MYQIYVFTLDIIVSAVPLKMSLSLKNSLYLILTYLFSPMLVSDSLICLSRALNIVYVSTLLWCAKTS